MSDALYQPTPDPQALLSEFFARNKAIYGDLRMEAPADGGDGGDGEQGDPDKPDDEKNADDWKAWARKHEVQSKANLEKYKKAAAEAKANADKAKAYDEHVAQQQTEDQKRQAAEAKAAADAEALRTENLRLKAASTHSISGQDEDGVNYVDLISGSDEDSINQSAQAISRLVSAAKERDDLKAEVEDLKKGTVRTGRPGALRSGATPPPDANSGTGSRGLSEAERRWGKPQSA